MRVKTSKLNGAALDWAVAECEGVEVEYVDDGITRCLLQKPSGRYAPTTDWSQAGPILERERIEVRYRVGVDLTASIDGQHEQIVGYKERSKPMLLAAMRCYVASKLGDEVEIPEELKGASNV